MFSRYLEDEVNGFGSVVDQPAANHHKAEPFNAFGGAIGDYLGNSNHNLKWTGHISKHMPKDRHIHLDRDEYDCGKHQGHNTYEGNYLG